MSPSAPRSLTVVLPVAMLMGGFILGGYAHNYIMSRREKAAVRVEKKPHTMEMLSAMARLEARLTDEDPGERCFAASVFARLGEPGIALPVLIDCLGVEDQLVRRQAAYALGMIGETAEPAVPALLEHLIDRNPEVRRASAQALARIGAVSELVDCLTDERRNVRGIAIATLGLMGDRAADAVPALTECLSDEGKDVRLETIATLAAIGEKAASAVPELTTLLGDKDPDIQQAAEQALAKIWPEEQ